MMRILAAVTGAATAVAGSLAGDRAGAPSDPANGMMGMGGGDTGLWIMVLGLVVIVAVAIAGNNIDDSPQSP